MPRFADYCPIATGVDVLGDRWTPLIIRELMVGSSGFNEIHRGIPRISRSLLASRLRQLERQKLVRRTPAARGRPGGYHLTPAGDALTPIVWAMGHWAVEWVFGEPSADDCDGLSILWRMHQHAAYGRLPTDRTVVHMILTGPGAAEGWLTVERHGITVCKDDPGLDVDLAVQVETVHANRWLIGLAPFRELVRDGHARVLGPSRLARAFPTWFDTSYFTEGIRRGERRRELERAAASA